MSTNNDRAKWLHAGDATCSIPPNTLQRPYRFVLLGAPGVGKGTQAELLAAKLGACHLSTGDVFRAATQTPCSARSPALSRALDLMREGGLISDDLVVQMVQERTACLKCQGGFLLDGFPRTVAQADAFDRLLEDSGVKLDAVISYELPLEQIIARLGGRRTCNDCKAVTHVDALPEADQAHCPKCGASLFRREDDEPATIRKRMAAYEQSTKPLTDYYEERGVLVRVACGEVPGETFQRSMTALSQKLGGAAFAKK